MYAALFRAGYGAVLPDRAPVYKGEDITTNVIRWRKS